MTLSSQPHSGSAQVQLRQSDTSRILFLSTISSPFFCFIVYAEDSKTTPCDHWFNPPCCFFNTPFCFLVLLYTFFCLPLMSIIQTPLHRQGPPSGPAARCYTTRPWVPPRWNNGTQLHNNVPQNRLPFIRTLLFL